MLPRGDRSIRNIPIPTHSKRTVHPMREVSVDEEEVIQTEPAPPRRKGKRRGRGLWKWAFLVVIIGAVAGVLLSTVFAGATVTVYAKQATVQAPETLSARLNAPVGTLDFELETVATSATTTVPATGTEQVSRQASGAIIISNTYSSASQRLIANTRFEATDGKIYRIRDSVTVPGGTEQNPGSITAVVYADSPGAAYNRSDATNFTIPGFKGDPRFTKITGKSTGTISGGFVGQEPAVAAAELERARGELRQQLDATARSLAASSIPEGYLAIPGTLEITFGSLEQRAGDNSTAVLSQTATAKTMIVREADLAAALARGKVENYQGEALAIEDIGALSLSVATTSKITDETVTLRMSGSPTLVWQYDPNALKEALLGKSKSEFPTIVSSFAPAVVCAEQAPCGVVIRPFWQNAFPKEADRITIVTAK